VYLPRHDRDKARQSAMQHLVQTFFDGSTGDAVAALLGTDASRLSSDQLERLAALIAQARKEDA
jgi:predicted transcriptional regulator